LFLTYVSPSASFHVCLPNKKNTNLPQLNGTAVYKKPPPFDAFFRIGPMDVTPEDPATACVYIPFRP